MKKYYYLFPIIFAVILILFFLPLKKKSQNENPTITENAEPTKEVVQKENTSLPNPASKYCEENGGELEIVANNDGSQFGICKFENYSCEEWTYMNGECTLEEDEEKIKDTLTAKGLNLSQSKVIIYKHLGKYIAGGVVPVDILGGGGYVFAVKDEGKIKVLADGNGAIMCNSFKDYPDFPSYLVSECVDEGGNLVTR